MRTRPWALSSYLLVFVIMADQMSKQFVKGYVEEAQHIVSLSPYLNLTLVMNKGVTFGLLDRFDHAYITYSLIAVAAVVVFFLLRWLWRTTSLLIGIALGCIIGGAIGNVIDRVRYGAVIDFLDFHYQTHHWYSFNVADAAIVTGVTLLLLDSLVRGR